jgi:hypothetical protein
MKFPLKILYGNFILVFSILFFFTFPLPAQAFTNIVISNNGSGSSNSVTINNSNIFTIIQTNFSNIINSITTNNNTGGNKCNNNTGSKCKIKTGNSNSNVDVTVTGNINTISVPEFNMAQGILTGLLCIGGFLILRKKAIL